MLNTTMFTFAFCYSYAIRIRIWLVEQLLVYLQNNAFFFLKKKIGHNSGLWKQR